MVSASVKEEMMSYEVMARYYASPDQIGESYVLTSLNFDKDTNFDIGEMVFISKEPLLVKNCFKWMRGWLEAYSKENELDVDKVMEWILEQPTTRG
jgi:hypothetical protein